MCVTMCKEGCIMRTNIDINDNLIKEAFKISSASTKKELVNLALKEFIDSHNKKNLLDIQGKIEFHDNYDYKRMRVGT